jgi:hypothetical protein
VLSRDEVARLIAAARNLKGETAPLSVSFHDSTGGRDRLLTVLRTLERASLRTAELGHRY